MHPTYGNLFQNMPSRANYNPILPTVDPISRYIVWGKVKNNLPAKPLLKEQMFVTISRTCKACHTIFIRDEKEFGEMVCKLKRDEDQGERRVC